MLSKGASKIGWGEEVKRNVIRLVGALLTLADEQSELEGSHPNQAVQARWVSQTKLQVTGKRKEKTARSEKIIEGTTLSDLVHLVETSGDSIEPVKPKKESGDSKELEDLLRISKGKSSAINALIE